MSIKVTNVSRQGFRLTIGAKDRFFVAFTVERPSANHLYWSELDIDLGVDSLDHLEGYPLVSRAPQVKERKAKVYTPPRRRGGRIPENRVRPGTPRT